MDSDQAQGKYEQEHNVADRLQNYFAPQPPVQATPESPTPSEEQKPAEAVAQVTQEPATQEPTEEEALEHSKNPERTKSYIERLKRERDEALAKLTPQTQPTEDYGTSVFDTFHPEVPVAPQVPQPQPNLQQFQFLNPQQAQAIQRQFVDENGNVDINGLNQALFQANQSAQAAEQRARALEDKVSRFEENQQVREAHTQHPEIDPSNREKFDPGLFNIVKDRLIRNMYEGKRQSLAEVAALVKKEMHFAAAPAIDPKKVEAEAVEKYKQTQAARNQGPFETGRGEPRQTQSDLDELRKQSRGRGPVADRAIGERLKRLGI